MELTHLVTDRHTVRGVVLPHPMAARYTSTLRGRCERDIKEMLADEDKDMDGNISWFEFDGPKGPPRVVPDDVLEAITAKRNPKKRGKKKKKQKQKRKRKTKRKTKAGSPNSPPQKKEEL